MVKKSYHSELASRKKVAKAMAKNKPISLKYATEIARELKDKPLDKAERFLQRITEKTEHLPLRRYIKHVPHRKGEAKSFTKSGRYPVRAAKAFLGLLADVKANADYKGMDNEALIIKDVFASVGFRRVSHQSQGKISGKRRLSKSTHIEIVVVEGKK